MTDTKLRELLVVIDDHYGRARSLEERWADTQIYIRAFGTIPDEIVEKALYTAFTQCRFQNQLIVDWCAEIKKLLSAQQPSANDLWAQAAAAARKIEENLYYQTHGGFIAPDGRKLKGEDFKKENAKIFAALPMVVQRCVFTGCNQSCFVSDIGNIGSRETRRLLGQERDIHISGQFQRFQVHFENFFPVFQFRQVDIDLAVETSGTKQGAVQNVRPVGCSQNNHPRIGLETVHLGQ